MGFMVSFFFLPISQLFLCSFRPWCMRRQALKNLSWSWKGMFSVLERKQGKNFMERLRAQSPKAARYKLWAQWKFLEDCKSCSIHPSSFSIHLLLHSPFIFISLACLFYSWVGYEEPGFEGRQHVLEEGEYLDWTDWGGTGKQLLSIRPVIAVSMHRPIQVITFKITATGYPFHSGPAQPFLGP